MFSDELEKMNNEITSEQDITSFKPIITYLWLI